MKILGHSKKEWLCWLAFTLVSVYAVVAFVPKQVIADSIITAVEKIVLNSWLDSYAYVFENHGHMFIVVAGTRESGRAIMHHPGCSCFKK